MKKRSVEGYEIGSDFISFFTTEGEIIVSGSDNKLFPKDTFRKRRYP